MAEPKTQSIDSILDAKVREYKVLLDRKEELESQTKDNNKAIEEMEKEIVQMMIDNEKPSTIVDGFNYSLKQETMYSKKSEEELLRLQNEEDIVFFESRVSETLSRKRSMQEPCNHQSEHSWKNYQREKNSQRNSQSACRFIQRWELERERQARQRCRH